MANIANVTRLSLRTIPLAVQGAVADLQKANAALAQAQATLQLYQTIVAAARAAHAADLTTLGQQMGAAAALAATEVVTDLSNAASPVVTVATPGAMIMTPSLLPVSVGGQPYSVNLAAFGGTAPNTFAVTAGSLPQGLTLSGNTISGTPTVQGTFNFTITATDSAAHSVAVAFTLTLV